MRLRRQCLLLVMWMSAAQGIGCDGLWYHIENDCELLRTCPRFLSSGTGDDAPIACVPSESESAVADACGVFVAASGDDASAGAKEAPMKTLAAALALAEQNETRRVYACAEVFEEVVEVARTVTIYGGLDCANGWGWVGREKKTTLTAGAGDIPLVMRRGGAEVTVHVEDVHVQARGIEAKDVALAGVSSIAAVADEVSVELVRCVLEAGDAAAGAEGAPYETSAMGGAMGNSGIAACSAAIVVPGASPKNDCGTPEDPSDDSSGGPGGIGQEDPGGPGGKGSPGATPNGGTGEEGTMLCTEGAAGADGAAGTPGGGARGLGEISASGYTGVAGSNGTKGGTAQGGGGGGGAKGGAGTGKCASAESAGGASGGSGGAGGCGGAGGRGGGAGGSSIALISLNATLSFEDVTLKTGRGGAGGKGGAGQDGGDGGEGGPGGKKPEGATGLNDACAGGRGGKGGAGGPGGGGHGGHAIGIAYKGAAPSMEGATIEVGEAGAGGPGANAEGEGEAGVKAEVQAF